MKQRVVFAGIQTGPALGSPEKELRRALSLIDRAFEEDPSIDLIALPEGFLFYPTFRTRDQIRELPEGLLKNFSERAGKYHAYLVTGSIIYRDAAGRRRNTSFVFDREGQLIAEYDKIHLFDVLDQAGLKKESLLVDRGQELTVFDADFGRVALAICYDIRFPEMIRRLALAGAEYLVVPAAFYAPRDDQWRLLLRAAALQNGLYVMGVNQIGPGAAGSALCGASLIAGPQGELLAEAPAWKEPGEGDLSRVIRAELDPSEPSSVREALGLIHNRVPGIDTL
ncbi:MAG: carbon-nitrogen hydrolase family protein [Anaerovoracaceae bacterium]|jgi:omega-amidase